jgi:predicted transcriptional regulator
MARPKSVTPTPGELEILRILWNKHPLSVREVMEALQARPTRAYTSVMSLLNVMADKGLVSRQPQGRAFVYAPRAGRKRTVGRLLRDLLGRAFEGSAGLMVIHLLEEANPTPTELAEIRRCIAEYEQTREKSP